MAAAAAQAAAAGCRAAAATLRATGWVAEAAAVVTAAGVIDAARAALQLRAGEVTNLEVPKPILARAQAAIDELKVQAITERATGQWPHSGGVAAAHLHRAGCPLAGSAARAVARRGGRGRHAADHPPLCNADDELDKVQAAVKIHPSSAGYCDDSTEASTVYEEKADEVKSSTMADTSQKRVADKKKEEYDIAKKVTNASLENVAMKEKANMELDKHYAKQVNEMMAAMKAEELKFAYDKKELEEHLADACRRHVGEVQELNEKLEAAISAAHAERKLTEAKVEEIVTAAKTVLDLALWDDYRIGKKDRRAWASLAAVAG